MQLKGNIVQMPNLSTSLKGLSLFCVSIKCGGNKILATEECATITKPM